MKHHRLVIFLALLVTLVGWAGSALLMRGDALGLPTSINQQRIDLQLTADADVLETMPPDMAVMYAGLGSFRGLVVNVLWYRANQLKEEGKHYEAMQLARLITRLQPKFASVWVFHGWNMAYNLSVTARTEQERWMWVQAGVDLLRDEAIPANPNNVTLHKELAWFFIHKINGSTDDMHWYYKRQLAGEWERLLGRPPVEDVQAYLDWFRPIAEMDRRFVNTGDIGADARAQLDDLIAGWPEVRTELRVLRDLPPGMVIRRVDRLIAEYTGNQAQLVAGLNTLRDRVVQRRDQIDRGVTPVERFLDAHPEAEPQIQRLRDLGFDLDAELLRRIGTQRIIMRAERLGYRAQVPDDQREVNEALRQWLENDDSEASRVRADLVLPFLRALVLRNDYHMSPTFMWELIRGDWLRVGEANRYLGDAEDAYPLPLDWRHPASHALYWAAMGVRRSLINRMDQDDAYTTVLNTDRTVLHALQSMVRAGRITHEPRMQYYALLPFPYFGEAYERAFVNAYRRIDFEQTAEDAPDAPKSFEAGHENLLITLLEQQYFYGSEDKARQIYRRLARLYGRQHNRAERYTKTLDRFVIDTLREDISSPEDARQAVTGWVYQAIDRGLANQRSEVSRRFLSTARQVHEAFQREHDYAVHNVERHRMKLQPFDQIQADVLTEYLTSPRISPIKRVRVWQTMVSGRESGLVSLARRIYDRIQPTLAEQMNERNVQSLFPPPPGMAAWRAAQSEPESEEQSRSR